eukprot:CAMPEP_0204630956 /NCGR_PEP_ID=MMETSP0717-20131115/21656_1 /ASSEMBLY_ACC=CAM_ASM_000666 /TAXON_ID=230516 /ORGANISM="Chaetoceros curvisetus" /LENGTH=56 /DNA_ID=CAMNT_0051648383 /DNA_START=174 /DNA_END=340 /DNA_ORIENTATION=+
MSSLADRINISHQYYKHGQDLEMKTSDGHSGRAVEIHATNMHPDINLSIQFLLNCG